MIRPRPNLPSGFYLIAVVVFALLVSLRSTASAAVVLPIGIETFNQSDSPAPGDGSHTRAIDGSGLTKPDANNPATWTHDNACQNDWQGFGANFANPNANYAVVNLGSPTANLDTMYLWNVNEGSHTGRGMREFEIYFATSPTTPPPVTSGANQTYDFGGGGWTRLGTTPFILSQGTGTAGLLPDSFDVSGAAGAQYLGFRMLSYYANDANRVGFAEVAFTTAIPTGAPTVETLPVTAISPNGARVRGDLVNLGNSPPSIRIYWGNNDGGVTAGAWSNVEDLGPRGAPGTFFADLAGLAPATTYHFRAFGTNAQGDDWAPDSKTFTTLAALPTVQNLPASAILGTSATLGGNVTSTGGEAPALVIYYGASDGGTDAAAWDTSLNLGPRSGSATGGISGLTPAAIYYYRTSANNSAGIAWAPASASFETSVVSPPALANRPATGINGTFATLNGEVTNVGGDPPSVTI